MKYNGKELVEMTPEKWDGKTRKMLVWDDGDTKCYRAYIVGYTNSTFKKPCHEWLAGENGWSNGPWQHCAEIPDEEKVETIEELSLKTKELREEIEELKKEIENLKENRSYESCNQQ